MPASSKMIRSSYSLNHTASGLRPTMHTLPRVAASAGLRWILKITMPFSAPAIPGTGSSTTAETSILPL